MIGGTDICIPTRGGVCAADLCLRLLTDYWPELIIEEPDTGQRWQNIDDVPLGKVSELFVYKNQEYVDKWDELGPDPKLSNTMIHILWSSSSITLVVDDDEQPPINDVLTAIRDNVSRFGIFNVYAKMEHAA